MPTGTATDATDTASIARSYQGTNFASGVTATVLSEILNVGVPLACTRYSVRYAVSVVIAGSISFAASARQHIADAATAMAAHRPNKDWLRYAAKNRRHMAAPTE